MIGINFRDFNKINSASKLFKKIKSFYYLLKMNKIILNKIDFLLNKEFYKSKFKGDLIWNYFSLIILGISGIGLNFLISFYYDPSTLGAFNQVLATYIVFSMFGSGGINYSVLRAVSENINKKIELRDIVCGAILPTFLFWLFLFSIYFLDW